MTKSQNAFQTIEKYAYRNGRLKTENFKFQLRITYGNVHLCEHCVCCVERRRPPTIAR